MNKRTRNILITIGAIVIFITLSFIIEKKEPVNNVDGILNRYGYRSIQIFKYETDDDSLKIEKREKIEQLGDLIHQNSQPITNKEEYESKFKTKPQYTLNLIRPDNISRIHLWFGEENAYFRHEENDETTMWLFLYKVTENDTIFLRELLSAEK